MNVYRCEQIEKPIAQTFSEMLSALDPAGHEEASTITVTCCLGCEAHGVGVRRALHVLGFVPHVLLLPSMQGVWMERPRAARSDTDVAASIPFRPVQCCSLLATPLFRGQ